MDRDYFVALYDYHHWAWDRVLRQVERMDEKEYFAPRPGFGHGSVHATLVHGLGADLLWLTRFEGESATRLLQPDDVPSLSEVRARWSETETRFRAFVSGLTPGQIDGQLHYRTTRGDPQHDNLWALLAHVVNHGPQHRAEIAVVLTQLGLSPGDVDMSLKRREEQARS